MTNDELITDTSTSTSTDTGHCHWATGSMKWQLGLEIGSVTNYDGYDDGKTGSGW